MANHKIWGQRWKKKKNNKGNKKGFRFITKSEVLELELACNDMNDEKKVAVNQMSQRQDHSSADGRSI